MRARIAISEAWPAKSRKVPARHCVSAGMTFLGFLFVWKRFGDPFGPPNRVLKRERAICRVKSRFPPEICRGAARSGLDPSNRPQTITSGLWCRQSLHQSLPEEKNQKRCHPGRRSRSGTLCRKVPWGPRSPLRSGGDDIVGGGAFSLAKLAGSWPGKGWRDRGRCLHGRVPSWHGIRWASRRSGPWAR